MESQLQIFDNSEFGKIGVLMIDGKPYFPATECARALGYKSPRDAIARHCKGDPVVKHDGVSFTVNQHCLSPAHSLGLLVFERISVTITITSKSQLQFNKVQAGRSEKRKPPKMTAFSYT